MLEPQDVLVLTGGDGTINRFLNEADYDAFENEILYYATGSGNDFLHDLDKPADAAPFSLRPYLKKPAVRDGQRHTRRFLNGIGYGIDGYCCEVGDRLRGTTDKPVNYTAIAIKACCSTIIPCARRSRWTGRRAPSAVSGLPRRCTAGFMAAA